jgi:phospholipid transport system substrate-binding protein
MSPRPTESAKRGVLCAGLLILGCLASLQAMAAEPDPAVLEAPRKVVSDTLDGVLEILNEPGLESAERRGRIQALAFEVFDFETMGKLSLARNWKKLSAEQRVEFIDEFKSHLARNYGSRLNRYQQTDVAVVGDRVEPRGDVTILTRVVGGQFDGVEMNYRMRERNDVWKVIDVVIEGVSLIGNFRSQFSEVMSRGGAEELLRQLRSKNFAADIDTD